jgi:hypothetical protein
MEQGGSSRPVAATESRAVTRALENAAVREQLRAQALARREQLYGTVRESLARVGVLATSYKFKVLALDQSGRQYLVMIDIAANPGADGAKLAEVEKLISDSAKSHYDIVVTAVYWRKDAGLGEPPVQVAKPPTPYLAAETPVPAVEAGERSIEPKVTGEQPAPRYEPLQTDEMLAFKRALAVTITPPAPAAARVPARSLSPLATGYEDTQVVSPETRPPGLGTSQYGELN